MADQKQRHGCLTAWLVLMIVANSATFLMYILRGQVIKQAFPKAPGWAFTVLTVFSAFNLVCAIALFKWKKWGFWGFVVSGIVAFTVNLEIGLGIGQSLFGLLGIVLLYAVLNIGKDKKGWPQLE